MRDILSNNIAQDFIDHVEALRDERADIEQQMRHLESDLQRVCLDLQQVWQKQTFDALACDLVDDGLDARDVASAIEEIKRQLGG